MPRPNLTLESTSFTANLISYTFSHIHFMKTVLVFDFLVEVAPGFAKLLHKRLYLAA